MALRSPVSRTGVVIFVLALLLGLALAWLPILPMIAVGLGGLTALIILLRPVWGVVLLIPVIPFSPLLSLELAGYRVGGMEALLAFTLLAWLAGMAARHRITLPHPPLLLPWLIWLAVIMVSWLVALSLGAAVSETAKWLEMLALYLLVVAIVDTRHLPWLVAATLAAGVAQAALGVYQSVWQVGPQGFVLVEGQFLRAYGTFQQPNPYAGYLGLVLPVAGSLILHGLLPGRSATLSATPRQLLPYNTRSLLLTFCSLLPVFILLLIGLYVSQSRGAWLGAAAALAVVGVARSRRAAAVFSVLMVGVACLLALGATGWLPSSVTQRFADVLPVVSLPNLATAEVTDANFPAIERLAHWQAALDMWRDHTWLGVGFGNYPVVYPAYAVGRWLEPLGHAHNFYLNVAAETGLLGLLAYGLFWLSVARLAWQAVRGTQGWWRALAIGALGSLVHLTVHNVVDNLYVQGMYLHISITLGLLTVIWRAGQAANRARQPAPISDPWARHTPKAAGSGDCRRTAPASARSSPRCAT